MKIASILVGAALGLAVAAPAALTSQQQAWLAKANRHEKAGWIYLHIEGAPRERGFQHGYLAAHEIADAMHSLAAQWHHDSSFDWPWLVAHTKGFINPAVDTEDREEMQGIADGMNAAGVPTTYDDVVTYNASIELTGYWWPEVQKKMDSSATFVSGPPERCSSFIATGRMTADGGVVLGHNTMSDFTEDQCNVILDLVPEKGHRILMQTQPGWIHSGTDFFVTDAGLVGSETTIGSFHGFTEKGVPEFVRMRRATQDAGSIDEWCTIMRKGNNGGYANAWLVGDINTREIARLELGLKYVGFERTKDGWYSGSNIAEDLHILRLETEANDVDIRQSPVARRVRWKKLMKENAGRIDLAKAKEFEGDCFDSCYGTGDKLNGRALDAHADLDPQLGNAAKAPYNPSGTIDAKAVDTVMARKMSFAARWGSGDGVAFDAEKFLADHPQFDWMEGVLKSRPAEPWVDFTAGEK
ncbi:MAG TPA: C45 family peptidase [Candidatus Didemnitutus sp.]|nr:C45 family peptidase [Candidatus Didemnitutus sp.]